MNSGNWKAVAHGKAQAGDWGHESQCVFGESSSDEWESLHWVEEGFEKKKSLVTLSRELKKAIGDVEEAKVLRDGNLLVIRQTKEQNSRLQWIVSFC